MGLAEVPKISYYYQTKNIALVGKNCKYTENFCTSLRKGILFIVLISELMSSWKIQMNKGMLNKYHISKSYLKLYVSPYNS